MALYHSPKSIMGQQKRQSPDQVNSRFRELRVSSCSNLKARDEHWGSKDAATEPRRQNQVQPQRHQTKPTASKDIAEEKREKIKAKIKSRITEYFRSKIDKEIKSTQVESSHQGASELTKKANIEVIYKKYLDDLYRSTKDPKKTAANKTGYSKSPKHATLETEQRQANRKKVQTFFRSPSQQKDPNHSKYAKYSNIIGPSKSSQKIILNLKGLLIQKFRTAERDSQKLNRTQNKKIFRRSVKPATKEPGQGRVSPVFFPASPSVRELDRQKDSQRLQPWGSQQEPDTLQEQQYS